ncbi:DUF1697 domain-containing protein [Actinoallomurus iriomotensis]|uniref:DUF1697 domain-containing protein n=1 Tax=Actinoallomurus iriomotensis TaxID=478107 RepID=A0A9W6VSI8_9ACTN|nr:DUF1697 domain-containing protein [Actinoallomurus iriomotensis]GLY76656.1 hypothetical protein Airi01_049230 [Actinoallomurus iriomotensis]
MTRYVALLRAVNLGSHKKISMADLRELLTGLGYGDVRTYLQSGNAIFTARETRTERVAAAIEERLAAGLGLTTEVILRTAEELQGVVEHNPLEVGDPAKSTVLFLLEPPPEDWLSGIDLGRFAPEEMRAGERELYYRLPNGIGRAKLPIALGRRLKTPATMRNWNTVTNLLSLAV